MGVDVSVCVRLCVCVRVNDGVTANTECSGASIVPCALGGDHHSARGGQECAAAGKGGAGAGMSEGYHTVQGLYDAWQGAFDA